MYKKRRGGSPSPFPLLKGGGSRKRRQVCLLLQKDSKRQKQTNTQQNTAVNAGKLPKRTLTGIALSIHKWEVEQHWFNTYKRHPLMDDPTFNPVMYIKKVSKRAQMHGTPAMPVVALPAPTEDSRFFGLIMGFLDVPVQIVPA